jgi:hypothetical protein
MLHQTMLLTMLLGTAAPTESEPITNAVPPPPERIDGQPFVTSAGDGSQSWGSTATYQLSTGELGETFLVVNSDGSGEAQLTVDGEIIAHVILDWPSWSAEPVLTTWYPSTLEYPPELIAEMMRVDLSVILAESIPQEFKCSAWGKKVMKAGKYMVSGLIGASGAACCAISQGFACFACGAGVVVGVMAVDEFAEGYCN